MAKTKRIPELRFRGFTEEWEERKLGEIMNVASAKRIHQSDWTDFGVRFFRARDIVSAFKNEDPNDRLYISKAKYEEYSSISGKVGIGDMLVTGVGTIGVPFLVQNLEPLYFKDGNIIWFQNKDIIDDSFFYYSFTGSIIQDYIHASAGIGTVGTYTIDSGKKTPISLPQVEEQYKIGSFLKNLDALIALHQRKHDKLLVVKKAMLAKMFPQEGADVPEIRFKGFSGKWERKKLENICLIGDIDHKMPKPVTDGIPYVMTGDFFGNNDIDFRNSKLISKDDYEQLSKKIKPEMGDILFARYASVGMVRYVEVQIEFLVSYSCAILKPNNEPNGRYLFYCLRSDRAQREIELEINAGSQRNIGIDSLKKLIILLPQIREQEKVATLLTSLDSLISLHQRELDKLKNIKKACLEKMFV